MELPNDGRIVVGEDLTPDSPAQMSDVQSLRGEPLAEAVVHSVDQE